MAITKAHAVARQQAEGHLLRTLEATLGGRENLIQILYAGSTADPKFQHVIDCIADPSEDRKGLARICAEQDLAVGDVLEAIKRGILAPAIIAGFHALAEKIPDVARETVATAVVHQVACEKCQGIGTVGSKTTPDAPPVTCDECYGRGSRTQQPDFERQKYVLSDLAGMGRKGTALINQTIDQSDRRSVNLSSPQGYAQFLTVADKLLYGRKDDLRIREST